MKGRRKRRRRSRRSLRRRPRRRMKGRRKRRRRRKRGLRKPGEMSSSSNKRSKRRRMRRARRTSAPSRSPTPTRKPRFSRMTRETQTLPAGRPTRVEERLVRIVLASKPGARVTPMVTIRRWSRKTSRTNPKSIVGLRRREVGSLGLNVQNRKWLLARHDRRRRHRSCAPRSTRLRPRARFPTRPLRSRRQRLLIPWVSRTFRARSVVYHRWSLRAARPSARQRDGPCSRPSLAPTHAPPDPRIPFPLLLPRNPNP